MKPFMRQIKITGDLCRKPKTEMHFSNEALSFKVKLKFTILYNTLVSFFVLTAFVLRGTLVWGRCLVNKEYVKAAKKHYPHYPNLRLNINLINEPFSLFFKLEKRTFSFLY